MKMADKTRLEWALDIVALLALGTMLVTTVGYYGQLPANVPTHFDASGTPDKYGSKATSLLLPGVAALLFAILTVITRFKKSFNYPVPLTAENTARQQANAVLMIRFLKAVIMIQFAYITIVSMLTAMSLRTGLGQYFLPIILVVTLGSVGFFIYRGYRLR